MARSAEELSQLLADLTGRRQRLLRLVPPGAGAGAGQLSELAAELQELSEQLVLAEEELQRQQEELDRAHRQIAAMAEELQARFEESDVVQALTDEAGVVLQTSRAAATLLRHPPGRRAPRPIVTWFDPDDRARVREAISVGAAGTPLALDSVLLRRVNGTGVLVDLRVTSAVDGPDGRVRLRWELIPAANADAELDETPPPALVPPPPGTPNPSLAVELTRMTTRLAAIMTLPETLVAVTEEAVRMVPGAEQAAILGTDKGGTPQVLAARGAVPSGTVGDELTVPLVLPDYTATALRLVASRPGTFQADAHWIADMLAVHFRVATGRALHKQNLEQAIATRQEIGQAVGVLVERRRMTPAAAFEELVLRSKNSNLKLREVARIVVETGQDPSEITGPPRG